jgi:Protein  of unknown function (DUF3018)
MGVHENLTGAQRAARYRAAKRAQGLRLKQIWVPDLRDPKVREQLRSEGAEINRRDRKSGIMAEIEAMGDELLASLPPYGEKPDAQ